MRQFSVWRQPYGDVVLLTASASREKTNIGQSRIFPSDIEHSLDFSDLRSTRFEQYISAVLFKNCWRYIYISARFPTTTSTGLGIKVGANNDLTYKPNIYHTVHSKFKFWALKKRMNPMSLFWVYLSKLFFRLGYSYQLNDASFKVLLTCFIHSAKSMHDELGIKRLRFQVKKVKLKLLSS